MPGVTMRDGLKHDVIYVADMSNKVYAFDFNTYELLWKQTVGNPIIVTPNLDMYLINPKWGILSTPVIDVDAKNLYLVSYSSPDGTPKQGAYWFHSLSISDGAAVHPPLSLNGARYTAPSGSVKSLGSVARKQRSALTLDVRGGYKTVFIPFGSFAESAATNLGWVLAVDVTAAPNIAAAWATGDKHPGAGIWMAGAGLSVGDDGTLHGMTGNGGFDPPGDVGECFFKLKYTPPTGSIAASLTCISWWSPYSDAGRAGLDPTLPTDSSGAMGDMEMAMPMAANASNGPTSNAHKVGDQDLGSGGPLYLPKSAFKTNVNILMGGGKDGILYPNDADNLGDTKPTDFAPGNIAGNYGKLLSPPWGWTYFPGDSNLAPAVLDELPVAYGGFTHHAHGQPVAYISPDHGILTFVQGENGPVRAVSISADGVPTYVACGTENASQGMPPPGGMPGGMLALSCSGQETNTAVLWALMPWYGDANKTVTAGRLVAYGANWVDGNGNLIKLWDSTQWNIAIVHNKFNIPTIAGGKVIVPSYDGRLIILG